VLLGGGLVHGQSVTVTAAPGNINLFYLQGATLPATQNVTVKASAPATYTTAIHPTGTTTTALWLTASPDSGALPAKVALHVNPTGLAVGTYTAAVMFTPAAAVPPGTAGTTNVKIVVTAPLPTLTLSPLLLAFTNPPAPAAQTVQLSTNSGPVSFSASAGTASWLTVAPTSGIVLPGGPIILRVTANPGLLSPQTAAYTAKITLTETGAASKTQTIPVSFAVNFQQPTVTGIWPPTGKVGGPVTTVTLFGTKFGAATVAKIVGPPVVALTTTYYSPTVISAVIPAVQLAAGTTLTIEASNPQPGGDSGTTVDFTFTPTVDAAVSAASYTDGAAPGELITLFGENIGPVVPAGLNVTAGYVDKALGGVSVKVDNIDAPMVYAGQHQISAQVPYGVALGTGKTIVVTNGANPSANGTIDIAATSPGIFTLDGSGGGQAAAINTSAATGAVTINSTGNAAKVGDAISLYLTGEGVYTNTPTPVDGYVIPTGTLLPAMPILTTAVTVTIGGVAAPVTYAGAFNDGMLGVLQINATIPAHTTGSTTPVVVSIGGINTQTGVTIATKP
jgi:uncharacterized protein (TIGR03437 family)